MIRSPAAVTELSQHLRLSTNAEAGVRQLGPLADLVGTWVGTQGLGWNIIAVPAADNGFTLLLRPYNETLTVTAIGGTVPNRGPDGTMEIPALQYNLHIADALDGTPMHVENGMWLLLNEEDVKVARIGTIPHGDSILALGQPVVAAGPPTIPSISAMPDPGPKTPLGYLDTYLTPKVDGKPVSFPMSDFNKPLRDLLEGQQNDGQVVTNTTTLPVSTANGGSLSNIPFIREHANATDFASNYWIETVKDKATGRQFMQLQYSQRLDLHFIAQFGNPEQLIAWPHISTNTLLKQ